MKKVRWGLLSTAHINRRVIPAIRASKRGDLIAVASRSLKTAKSYASEWQIPGYFGSYDEMLSSGEIDAVYVSLPNHLHAEWTIRAVNAGVHVLCEKPFCLSEAEFSQMKAASQSTGMVLAEAFMYRHHPQTKIAMDWVQNGKLGEISLIQGHFSFAMQNPAGNIRMSPETGGGALWDIGIYPLSFAQYIFQSPPISVSAVQSIGETGVDETFVGQMEYENGRIAQIACSFRMPFHTAFTIHGTLGRIEITQPFTNINESKFTFTPVNGNPQKIRFSKPDPYLGEIDDMHSAILDQHSNMINLEETRNHICTAVALYSSAKSGNVVHLD